MTARPSRVPPLSPRVTVAANRVAELAARPRLPALPSERVELELASGALLHVYPPIIGSAAGGASAAAAALSAPVVWMLHGMCMDARGSCEYWGHAGRKGSWLACPDGNAPCGAGRRDWSGGPAARARYLHDARRRLVERFGDHVAPPGKDILMGFSRGGFVARDVVYGAGGGYRSLLLMGAAAELDPERLRRAGITRMALVSGDFDGARSNMIAATSRLEASGIAARFFGAGAIWHQMPADFEQIAGRALGFLRADERR